MTNLALRAIGALMVGIAIASGITLLAADAACVRLRRAR